MIGVSHKVGQLMSYWILPDTGKVISCTTIQRLTNLEQSSPEWDTRMNKFNQDIEEKVVNPIVPGAVKNAKTAFLRRLIFDKMS